MTGHPAALSGFRLVPGYLDRGGQETLLAAVRDVIARAPLSPANAQERPPALGAHDQLRPARLDDRRARLSLSADPSGDRRAMAADPAIPFRVWPDLSSYPLPPEACLVNLYGPAARMGLHQDRDEEDFAAPVVSLSLGDACLFRIGGTARPGPTRSIRLGSGDALVLGGEARLAFHGVDRIIPGTSTLLAEGGRINLTLRRVTRPV